jgi:hypothetical protein
MLRQVYEELEIWTYVQGNQGRSHKTFVDKLQACKWFLVIVAIEIHNILVSLLSSFGQIYIYTHT